MGRDARAFQVEEDDRDQNVGQPGAYYFMRDSDKPGVNVGIIHGCPCGCGGRSAIWFKGLGPDAHHEWDVAGEWPNVTLSPSIGIRMGKGGMRPEGGGYHWHGYLENGVFVER
jgi:hypothetical protein